jgi:hypothetical protein
MSGLFHFSLRVRIVLAIPCVLFALSFTSVVLAQSEPIDTTICEINKSPTAFSGKMLRIRGFVSSGFEDFTFHSKDCDRGTGIWLMYADDKADMNYWSRTPKPGEKTVEYQGESYPIVRDKDFREFTNLIAVEENEEPVYQVTATITGIFFAQTQKRYWSGQVLPDPGYGHLGCCHLLVMTAVSEITKVRTNHSKIRGLVVNPEGRPLQGVSVEAYGAGIGKNHIAHTNQSGMFRSPRAYELQVTKDGYQPSIVVVDSATRDYEIVLRRLPQPDWIVPDCPVARTDVRRIGRLWQFEIPNGTEATELPNQGLSTKQGWASIPFGSDEERMGLSGALFPDMMDIHYYLLRDLPVASFRWIRDSRGPLVGADIRGITETGTVERLVTFLGFGDAFYVKVMPRTAEFFDHIIDSVCYSSK